MLMATTKKNASSDIWLEAIKYPLLNHWPSRNYSSVLHQPQIRRLMFIWDSNPSFPMEESQSCVCVQDVDSWGVDESRWVTHGPSAAGDFMRDRKRVDTLLRCFPQG